MRPAARSAGETMLVTGGRIRVDVRRSPCPAGSRPCGEDCPFQREATAGSWELAPTAPRFRPIVERVYCSALTEGAIDFVPGGATAEVEVEVPLSGGEAAAEPLPVAALRVSVAGITRRIGNGSWCTSLLLETRDADVRRTERVAPRYWPEVSWTRAAGPAAARTRAARAPVLRVGRRAGRGDLPRGWDDRSLDLPRGVGTAARPLVDVVWRDAAGLDRAREAAAREPSREIMFLLLGAMRFADRTRTAFTDVHRVVPVRDHQTSNEVQATLSPGDYAAARAVATRSDLDVVGILHSHVLETPDGPHVDGLFYSRVDAADHEHFLPSAWSLGGVLNVRPDGAVELALFARDAMGAFAPVPRILVPPHENGAST